jgi:hypothetical protein
MLENGRSYTNLMFRLDIANLVFAQVKIALLTKYSRGIVKQISDVRLVLRSLKDIATQRSSCKTVVCRRCQPSKNSGIDQR